MSDWDDISLDLLLKDMEQLGNCKWCGVPTHGPISCKECIEKRRKRREIQARFRRRKGRCERCGRGESVCRCREYFARREAALQERNRRIIDRFYHQRKLR